VFVQHFIVGTYDDCFDSHGLNSTVHLAIEPDTLPSKFNMKLIQHMQKLNQDVFTPQAVYDGRKNMFAARRLPLGNTNSREVCRLTVSPCIIFTTRNSLMSHPLTVEVAVANALRKCTRLK